MPSGCQAGEVRHRGARDESDFALGRQAEQFADPVPAHLFEGGGDRRRDLQKGILIPRRRQHVGREGGGEGAADDKTEEPASRAGDRGRRTERVQLRQDRGGREGLILQRPGEPAKAFQRARPGRHSPFADVLEVTDCTVRRIPQQLVHSLLPRVHRIGNSRTLPWPSEPPRPRLEPRRGRQRGRHGTVPEPVRLAEPVVARRALGHPPDTMRVNRKFADGGPFARQILRWCRGPGCGVLGLTGVRGGHPPTPPAIIPCVLLVVWGDGAGPGQGRAVPRRRACRASAPCDPAKRCAA